MAFRWPGGAQAAVCLTYDDGLDVHLDHVVPDLEALKLRGTFYVPGQSRSLYNRMDEWRAVAQRGHERGNHSLFHPRRRIAPDGSINTFVPPEHALEIYTIPQMFAELRTMNTLLLAVDNRRSRTYANTCSEYMAGNESFIDALRPLFVAARGGEPRIVADFRTLDLHHVPSWAVVGVSADEMIAFVNKAVDAGGLAVFMFHGVGGGHNTFIKVLEHIAGERKRLGW